MHKYYLIDHEYLSDDETLRATMGHLLAFNPGKEDADLTVTVYFPDADPKQFALHAPAGRSTESNYTNWCVEPNTRFALEVASTRPLVCQSTNGWNVTNNDYRPDAATRSPRGVRECAKSYTAITRLARDWYLPDGVVIDLPERMYVRESEWAIVLNPGDSEAAVTMTLHYDDGTVEHGIAVPPQRLRVVHMDEIVRRNAHYGAHFSSDREVAAQWLRSVNWNDCDELMAYWSVPCVPGPLTD